MFQLIPEVPYSNKNILHNWDFRKPVNQRGASSYSGNVYGIDRWATSGVCQVAINAGTGITITSTNASCGQVVENYANYAGKKFTLSLNVLGGTGIGNGAVIQLYDGTQGFNAAVSSTGIVSITGVLSASPTTLQVNLFPSTSTTSYTLQVSAVKLELGSVSTLVNDPPADFGEQLRLCQRYYEKSCSYNYVPGSDGVYNNHGSGMIAGSTTGLGNGDFTRYKVQKRIVPTLTFFGGDGATYGANYARDNNIGGAVYLGTAPSVLYSLDVGFYGLNQGGTGAGALVAGHYYVFGWTASADL
jgi:hypothetical protein